MKNLIILFTFFFCSQLLAGEDLADARYLQMKDTYTLEADGAITHVHEHQIKLLTYYAFNRRYGETFIVHNPQQQKLTVNRNQTTMADGKVVPAPFNALNPVLPRFARNAPAYNQLREMVVTHTALERQAVIDLEYTLESKPGYLPGLQEDFLIQEDAPVVRREIIVRIPDGQKLTYTLLNNPLEPAITAENGYQVYRWQFENLPALISEPAHRPFGDAAVRLLFSTVDEQKMLAVLENQWQNFSAPFEVPGRGSALQRALEAQKRVVKEIDLTPVPFVAAAYRFRDPQTVWHSNYGTAVEKAVLLATVLKDSGIPARALLISESIHAGGLPSFTKAAVCVRPTEGGSYLLDVNELNARDLRFRYAGHPALALGPKTMRVTLPKAVKTANTAQMAMQLQVTRDGMLEGTFTLNNRGAANPYLHTQGADPKLEQLVAGVIKGAEAQAILEMSAGAVGVQAGFAPQKLEAFDGFYSLDLPQNPQGSRLLHLQNLSVTRTGDLQIPIDGFSDSTSYSIAMPEGTQAIVQKIDLQKANSVGRVTIQIFPEKAQIRVIRALHLNQAIVPRKDYQQFMELWQIWQTPKFKKVVLRIAS